MDIEKSEINNIRWSLITAVESGQYLELYNDNGKFVGFVTWLVGHDEKNIDEQVIVIENLVIIRSARGTYNLKHLHEEGRRRYPNAARFVWRSRKRKKQIEFKQRGTYVENAQKNLQFTS